MPETLSPDKQPIVAFAMMFSAIGRAPIVKMSRMMPPTPVAAPW